MKYIEQMEIAHIEGARNAKVCPMPQENFGQHKNGRDGAGTGIKAKILILGLDDAMMMNLFSR